MGAPLLLTPEELRGWFRGFREALQGGVPTREQWTLVCAAVDGMLTRAYERSSYVPSGKRVLDLPTPPREPQPTHRPDGTQDPSALPSIDWRGFE